jgi:uncharacterized protein
MVQPFRQFILKVHSRCDLACSYCYVYQHVDQTWRHRPVQMPEDVVAATARRIAQHARRHRVPRLRVILHGGEPLLAGPDRLAAIIETLRAAIDAEVDLQLAIQTNGVRLNAEFLELFLRLGVRVGVSLDGGLATHNRRRMFAHGGSSFAHVAAALGLLRQRRYRPVYGGALCVIDLANDPVEVFHGLAAFEPPMIGLALPHGNWVHPPPGRPVDQQVTPYGDWLVRFFDAWYGSPVRSVAVRPFDAIIAMLLGGDSDTDGFGTTPTAAVTVDTDGSIQHSDSLKTTEQHAPETGLNVRTDAFDAALELPLIRAEQRSLATVPAGCRPCPIMEICGGGLFAHRFGHDGGFDHPSVYSPDLIRLITHVAQRVRTDLRSRLTRIDGPGVADP